MGRYSKYQNTDNWFGTIPATWETHRIKRLFALRDKRNFLPLEQVNLISLYSNVGVRQHCDIEHTTGNRARNADGYKVVHKDDIIVNILLCWMGAIGRSDYDGVTSPAYDVYMPRTNINSQYYHYLFRTKAFSGECYKVGKGIMAMRWRTYSSQFMNINVPEPPRAEQDQIVRFLDWKVSEINKLIGIRRKEIQELEELKKSVINDSVKHGLNHTIYKDSGIRWIGQIPDSWKIHKTKQHVIITNGRNPEMKGDIPVYGSGRTSFCTCGEYKNGPAVLLGRKGSIKEPQYITGKYWNVDTAFDVILRLDDFNLKYFYYLATQFEYDYYTTQTAIPSMTQTDYNNISIPVPPLEEQNLIVTFLDSKCEEIDNGINLVKEKIFALQELKSVIISDVVTGKIDVRNIPVPAYEHVDDLTADDGEGNDEETGIPGEED